MVSTKRLRVGVAGLGMGRNHAWAALQVPCTDLAAIAEPNESSYNHFLTGTKEQFGAREAKKVAQLPRFDSYQDLIKSGAVDALCIALPTDMHYDATRYCLQRNIHVLCEKPPTTNAAQMVKLARMVYDRGLAYAYVRQQRFDTNKMACRDLAQKGRLGRIYHAESHWNRTRNIPFRGGWGVNKDAGGGVLLDLGVHKVDDAWFCMGNPTPEVAFGQMHCGFDYLGRKQKLSMPYNADDLSVGMIRFTDGATLNLSTSFAMNRVQDSQQDQSVKGNCEWQELHILGTRGGVDVMQSKLIKDAPKGVAIQDLPKTRKIATMKTGFVGLVEDFALAALNGTEPLNSARQAVQLMSMLEALRTSAETGKAAPVKSIQL